MKQDELDGDLEFIVTIELEGKSANYRKINKRQSWKWRVCRAYKNPISGSNVGQMNFENKGKAYGAQVVSTTRDGMTWNVDWGSSKKS